ncbi:Stem 28 kDa glycoprotein [Vitis vinifera]|uniref:Stem 28 kDa glycoprotein n=1 Tax=Vitis vinifera TaxID=29760 RepID=A0A438BUG0_VITVI|nr:Stem 28 kDa glycoprotein [Vitis vinifera]
MKFTLSAHDLAPGPPTCRALHAWHPIPGRLKTGGCMRQLLMLKASSWVEMARTTGKYNATLFNSWVLQAKAPALPESLKLYKKLLSLGIKVVFLTGRGGSQRNATVSNLKKEGFLTWEKLILRV